MEDILIKTNHKKLNALTVIYTLNIQDKFYDWVKIVDPMKNRNVYSLKRLAKEFLAAFPHYYSDYDKTFTEEAIHIVKTPWLED